jgi:predicted polyphosphate/ATP-dependent NAD kinase
MVRIGLLVNPDAGLGGRLGLKGSDGQANFARSMGAEDRAGPRVSDALLYFSKIYDNDKDIQWYTSKGRMGSQWIPDNISIGNFNLIHESSGSTSQSDTSTLVSLLIDSNIDLILYAGGDGTTRDIVSTLDSQNKSSIPVIGIPCGVKMHSGCFASSPKAGAEVLSSWLNGDLLLSSTEGRADHIRELLIHDDRLVIWGSGGTLRTISNMVGFEGTVLGIDATLGNEQVGTDLNEEQLIDILSSHKGEVTLLLSPMGGQGFLIGRGNLQLSPSVLRKIPIDDILGVVTPAKLISVRRLRIETGDEILDNRFSEKKYMKVLQGYRTTRVLPIIVD